MKILIVGAGRGVGRAVAERAIGMGHEVVGLVRSMPAAEPALPGVTYTQGDASLSADIDRRVSGQDAVICTLGADRGPTVSLYSAAARNLVSAMSKHSVRRLIYLSNFGVLGERSPHPVTALMTALVRLTLQSTLADHREALRVLDQSDLNWTAVRPMALTNGKARGAYRVSRSALPAGGFRIARADVADFMLKELDSELYSRAAPAIAY